MEILNFTKKRDDIFTIDLPGADLVFTRYLYVKDEVRIALLVSILNKSDDAIFWAYELYHSGFKNEFFELIWKIYYDFFATLNPTFEAYLLKKHKEVIMSSDSNQDRIISSIIQDLLFRPFNSDIFIIRTICENFETESIYHHSTEKIKDTRDLAINLEQWQKTNDYRSISHWILNVNTSINIVDVYNICLNIFEKNGQKLTKNKLAKELVSVLNLNINANVILLAKIICLFSKKAELKKGKSIYINVEPEDVVQYETISSLEHYKVLENACICGIDDLKHLSLFKLNRKKYNIKHEYFYRWEYHASFSPIWSQRIRQFGGYPDYTSQKIIFKEEPDDEQGQTFYELYGLEPDEQSITTQEKNIMKIEKIHNWKWFNEQYKKNGLFEAYEEELEEFDLIGITY
jgi:hypothetical protein